MWKKEDISTSDSDSASEEKEKKKKKKKVKKHSKSKSKKRKRESDKSGASSKKPKTEGKQDYVPFFDRERDIVTPQIDAKKRAEIVAKSAALNSRFSSGSATTNFL